MTGLQSNAAVRRPVRVPTAEELPPLLERTPLAILDEAVTFLRLDARLLLSIAFIVLLPLRLVASMMPGSALRDARPDQTIDIIVGNLSQPGAVLAAFGSLAADSIAVFAVAAIYGRFLATWYSGRTETATDALLWSIKRSPILAILWLIIHVVEIGAALFTAGAGGLIAAVFVMVVAPVLGAENAGIGSGMSRSMALVSPRFMSSLAVFVLTAAAGQIMRLVLRLLPTFLGISVLPVPSWIVSGIFDLIATTVMVAFTAATASVHYLDLRIRREGIDLDMAMARTFPGARVRQAGHG